jgi:hypothetical protein
MVYQNANEGTSPPYSFTENFDAIAKPGMLRFLEACAACHGNAFDVDRRAEFAKSYRDDLWRSLSSPQTDAEIRGEGDDWNAEGAAEIAAQFEANAIHAEMGGDEAESPPCDPVPPDDPVMAAAAEIAEAQISGDAWTAHSEAALRSAGQLLQDMRNRGVEDNAELVAKWMLKQVRDDRRRAEDEARRQERAEQAKQERPKQDNASSKFALTWLKDVKLTLDDEWLFKGLIPKIGVVSVFGESKSFKTFILIHMAVCATLGRAFAWHKCKNPGVFVYIAAEDAKGVEKRLVGYCMAHGISREDVPIAIVGVAPNLGTVKGDAMPLASAIDTELQGMGYGDPSGIIIDTLNQTLGDAEENGTGMQAFLINAGLIADGFSCPVFAANHVGHAEKGRERGGSQIQGNAATRLQIERVDETPTVVDGVKTFETLIHARKVKNAEDGFSLKATLRQFVLGKDQDGDDVTTLVVDRVEAAEAAPRDFTFRKPCDKAAPVKTTAGEDEALAALAKATKEHGWATPDGEDGPVLADLHVLPVGTVTVSVDEWRDAFRSLDHERGRKACWTAFDRAAGGLVKKNIVGEYSNRRWRLL